MQSRPDIPSHIGAGSATSKPLCIRSTRTSESCFAFNHALCHQDEKQNLWIFLGFTLSPHHPAMFLLPSLSISSSTSLPSTFWDDHSSQHDSTNIHISFFSTSQWSRRLTIWRRGCTYRFCQWQFHILFRCFVMLFVAGMKDFNINPTSELGFVAERLTGCHRHQPRNAAMAAQQMLYKSLKQHNQMKFPATRASGKKRDRWWDTWSLLGPVGTDGRWSLRCESQVLHPKTTHWLFNSHLFPLVYFQPKFLQNASIVKRF